MIGLIHKHHKIIAALPVRGGEPGHMIVVGKQLPLVGKRHSAQFVTWWTDGQGTFDSPVFFTDHRVSVETLRTLAIGDMINRADYTLAALTQRTVSESKRELAEVR